MTRLPALSSSGRLLRLLVCLVALGLVALQPASAHSAAAELGAGVGADYTGAYPYPPGSTAVGSMSLPPRGAYGGFNYDCVELIKGWNVLAANKMYGLAVYRDATGTVLGVHTRSGELTYNAPSNPPQTVAAVVGHGQVTQWDKAVVTLTQRNNIHTDLSLLFGTARKCFGVAAASARCQYDATTKRMVRSWTAVPAVATPANEQGAQSGVCALTRLAFHLSAAGIPRDHIICAAERTHNGWNSGRHVGGAPAPYGAGDIVSSCVTCQQQVPFILGSDCRGIVAPAHATMGSCAAHMLDGESCAFHCTYGGLAAATCLNGAFTTAATCPAGVPAIVVTPPTLLQAQEQASHASSSSLRRVSSPLKKIRQQALEAAVQH